MTGFAQPIERKVRHPSDVEAVASVKSWCCYAVGMDGSRVSIAVLCPVG